MIKVQKKYKNNIIKEPVPRLLKQFIQHCDAITGNEHTRKYTKIIFQMYDTNRNWRGLCYQWQYKIVVYPKHNDGLTDILDTIAHELVHLMTLHVLEVNCEDTSTAYKRENWNTTREEFLAESIAYKLVQSFINKHMIEYYDNYDKLVKYFEAKS